MLTSLQNVKLYKNTLEYFSLRSKRFRGVQGQSITAWKKRGQILALDPISRGQNTVLWSFFASQPHGNACYASKAAFRKANSLRGLEHIWSSCKTLSRTSSDSAMKHCSCLRWETRETTKESPLPREDSHIKRKEVLSKMLKRISTRLVGVVSEYFPPKRYQF